MTMTKPSVLDLFCGAGMAADGYAAAFLRVDQGVDIRPQPHYPYAFFQGNALGVLESHEPEHFDVIHASPPCQLFTRAKHLREAQGKQSKETIDLLAPTLDLLRRRWSHKVWVVENVENAAPLMPGAVRVCGSAFGLQVQRHRLFLSNIALRGTECRHDTFPPDPITGKPRPWGVYYAAGDSIPKGGRTARDVAHGRELFGVTRSLTWDELKEGFPPAYTQFIGGQVLAALEVAA